MATPALTPSNYFSTTLTSSITTTDTTIFVGTVPTGSEGYLEIGEGLSTKEIIYHTSKGANFVTLPSVGAGRGVGGTSASAHTSGEIVKQKLNAEWWLALQNGTALGLGSVSNTALAANTAWTTFTPTWQSTGGPTIGNGTLTGSYQQIGKTVHFRIYLLGGSTTTWGTGGYSFTLPITASASAVSAVLIEGTASADNTGVETYQGLMNLTSTTAFQAFFPNGTADTRLVGHTVTKPFAPGTGDSFRFAGAYEAA